MAEECLFDIKDIQDLIPHRYPFLMVDRVVELVDNQRCVTTKCVTINEPYFQGHFPGRPIMPGVLMIEAMAQTCAILAMKSTNGVKQGRAILLVGADEFKWKRQVVPGDVLRIEMTYYKRKGPYWMLKGTVSVDGNLVCSGTISAVETD